MTAHSITPYYALPTRSSVARSHLKPPVSKSSLVSKSQGPLTVGDRTQHRNPSSRPLAVKATGSQNPCPLLVLPPELRLCIYSYLLPRHHYAELGFSKFRNPWWILFQICRVVRTEAMYEFYTKTNFTLPSITIDHYEALTKWLLSINPEQRLLLAKNPNLRLPLRLNLPWTFDHCNEHLWRHCRRFGNVYEIENLGNRLRFARFCSLASWLLWCKGPLVKDISWSYEIRIRRSSREMEHLNIWYRQNLHVVALTCVQNAWAREERKREMKEPALKLLEAIDSAMQLRRRRLALPPFGDEDWNCKIGSLQRFLNTW